MSFGELQPGALFAQDYRIVRLLSTGGMGAVYVAEQLSTNKERALKLMRPELVTDADLRRRFEQEARVSAKIASDHVVEIVGAGVDDATGMPWLAMELLEGEELFDFAERVGALEIDLVRAMYEQLCHALAAAHALKIVHRDLKPENIFLATPRRPGVPFTVKILDFGIAKTLADAEARATASVGTPLWMAPEQTTQGAAITPATDVWALGLIAFRLLSGRYYWKSAYDEGKSTAMLLREVLIDPMVPASERVAQYGLAPLPPGFDEWFARCTAREPSARFEDAGVMYRELAPLLGGTAPLSLQSITSVRSIPGSTRASGNPATPSSAPAATAIAMASTAYATPAPFAPSSLHATGQPVSAPAASAVPLAAPPRSTGRIAFLAIAGAIVVLVLGVFIGFRARGPVPGALVHRAARRGRIVTNLPPLPGRKVPRRALGPPVAPEPSSGL